jgi:signal transduction histidine kinase
MRASPTYPLPQDAERRRSARRYNAAHMDAAHPESTHVAPGRILAAALALAAAALLATLWLALHEPWLGATFREAPAGRPGLVVAEVDAAARAAGLRPGDEVRALRGGGRTFEIPPGWLVETPSYFIRYADYNAFLRQQAELHALLRSPAVELVRGDGGGVQLEAAERPLAALPASFWYQVAYALLAFSVGASLLAFRAADPAARWFALTSFGFFLGTLMRALYGSRNLVVEAGALETAVAFAHLCALCSTAALACFAWHFPRRWSAAPFPAAVFAFAGAAWVADTWQLLPTTNLAYRGPLLALTAAVAGLALLQWWRARRDPAQRVLANWMLIILLAAPGIWAAGLAVVATGVELVIPRGTHGLSTALLIYLGMVLLIMKQRAFELERWWIEGWTWFLCGALVIAVDLLLIHALAMQETTALAVSLAAIGWLYFPFRQWLLAALWRRQQRDLRDLFPDLVRILLAPADGAPPLEERWRALLASVFEPRALVQMESGPASVRIEQGGLRLVVPQSGATGAIALDYADGGERLFSRRDARLAQGLLDLLRQGASYQDGYWRGVESERDRIARDLHDDIGAKLLTLIHESNSERVAGLARAAVAEMREVVAGLRAQPLALADALADWRAELAQRAAAAGCEMTWRQPDAVPATRLSPRQQLNLARILREAASNALRHAGARAIEVVIEFRDGALGIEMRHGGAVTDPAQWREGTGLATMRRRAADLAGSIAWRREDGAGLRLALSVPLPAAGSA